jgi:hypothetical protein
LALDIGTVEAPTDEGLREQAMKKNSKRGNILIHIKLLLGTYD